MGYIASESAFQAGSGVFVDTFTAGVDYTAGTSSQVTLSNVPASPNAVWVFFNGVAQHHSEYTVSGSVISFTSVIPTNVSTIQVQVNTQLAVGVPGDATVNMDKLTSGAVTSLQRKNAIINGNFDIWQRGTSQTAAGYGSADRWTTYFAGTGATLSCSQQAFALGQTLVPNEPEWFARHTVVSGTDVATDVKQRHFIEGVRSFAGDTVTVSFYAKGSVALDTTVEFAQQFGTGGSPSAVVYVTPQKVSLTTSWQKYELTFNIPSISGKTIGTDGNDRLQMHFWFSSGSNFNARSDTLGLQTGTFDIAQVQVEKGTTATDFERRHIADELALCQRYFYRISNYAGRTNPFDAEATGAQGTGTGAAAAYRVSSPHPVVMRDTPVISYNNVSVWDGTSEIAVSSTNNDNSTRYVRSMDYNLASSTTGTGVVCQEFVEPSGYIDADAEL